MEAQSTPSAELGQSLQTAGYRLGLVSLLAALVGIAAGFVAYALYDLIGLFTNLDGGPGFAAAGPPGDLH